MNRAITIALGACLALTLAACDDGAPTGVTDATGSVSEAVQEEAAAEDAAQEDESPDGRLVYEGDTMRIYYHGTEDLADMGLDGMLQADFVVENLSGEECMVAPVMGECVCNGYNVTMTGGALVVSPGNKAACPVQLAYSQQTSLTSFDQVTDLTVKLQQTGEDILNPLATVNLEIAL